MPDRYMTTFRHQTVHRGSRWQSRIALRHHSAAPAAQCSRRLITTGCRLARFMAHQAMLLADTRSLRLWRLGGPHSGTLLQGQNTISDFRRRGLPHRD
jgi:hypothetical protein